MTRRRTVAVGGCLIAVLAVGCSSDPNPQDGSSDPTTEAALPLVPLLLSDGDLPEAFERSLEVDDTVTTFCAGQDAAAGLQASEREVVGYTRVPPGASVIHLVFRFEDDGAERFVAEVQRLLDGCSEIPDATGLAFTYEPMTPDLGSALAQADSSAGAYGTSVGSQNLSIQVAAIQDGEIAELIAVSGLGEERTDLDSLALDAIDGAIKRLQSG